MENFDIKTIFIFILGGLLILATIFNQNKIKTISNLEEFKTKSEILLKENKKLVESNKKLDSAINVIKQELEINKTKLDITKKQLENLNNKRDEIYTKVNRLSANDVANAFTEYLNKRTKSSNPR